ncbi:hypothetical protein [Azospirillum palustre]
MIWNQSNWSIEIRKASLQPLLSGFAARSQYFIPAIMECKRRPNRMQFGYNFLTCVRQIPCHLSNSNNPSLDGLLSNNQSVSSSFLMLRDNISLRRYIMWHHVKVLPTCVKSWRDHKNYHFNSFQSASMFAKLSEVQKFLLEDKVGCAQASITKKSPSKSFSAKAPRMRFFRPLIGNRPPSGTEHKRPAEEGSNATRQTLPMVQPLPKWTLQMCRRCRQSRSDLPRISAGLQLPFQRRQSLIKEWPREQQEHHGQYEEGQFNTWQGWGNFLHALNLWLDRTSMQAELVDAEVGT